MKRIIAIVCVLIFSISFAEVEIVNGNIPYDDIYEWMDYGRGFEYYQGLDVDPYGRATLAVAWICEDNLPEGTRKNPTYKPTGWVQAKYDCIPGKWLWNRCHMIAWCLTAEANNPNNLFTGTRQLNQVEMVEYEQQILACIREGGEVLYRVSLEYEGEELVCRSVLLEAVQMNDDGLCFCVRIYNEQPGIEINYTTGESAEKFFNPY